MDREALRFYVRSQAPETDKTDAQLNVLLERAQQKISEWCRLILTRDETTGADGTQNYDLPDTFIDFDINEPVTYDNERLEKKELQWLQDNYTDEIYSKTGTPLYWWLDEDFTSINIIPIPDSNCTGSGESLIVPCVIKATSFSSDTSEPWNEIPAFENFHDLVADYVVYIEKLGAGEISQAETAFKQNYRDMLTALARKATILRKGFVKHSLTIDIGDYNEQTFGYSQSQYRY